MSSTIENDLGFLLNLAVVGSRKQLDEGLREVGLTERQWAVVRYVWRAREAGRPLDTRALLNGTDLQLSDIDAAVARGLLAIGEEGELSVTQEAERLNPLTATIAEAVVTRATSGFTAEEMASFAEMLRRYIRSVAE